MQEVLMMFLGGLGVAIAIEYCTLHERIALKVLRTIGTDTKWLMLGFMSTTMFLSMWISNTATTAMMVPIIDAVMCQLNPENSEENNREDEIKVLHRTLLLSAAYSANCGGTGTITGTSPNMIFKGFVEELYPKSHEVTYASWIAYNVPGMLLCVFAAWVVLQAMYIPWWHKQDEETKERISNVISSRYEQLGPMKFHEAAVLTLFIVLVLLWFFREPKFMTGWAELLGSDAKIGDSVPAIGILILLHLLPAEPWKMHKSPPLVTWKFTQEKMPWGLIILLGGGYALANGSEKSGFSKWLGAELSNLSFLPPAVILIIIWLATTFLTEVMSNSAVASLMIPVVNQMALASNINPLYFMLPVTVIASHAFMLPVATGPNAIVFGTGLMKTSDMIKAGLVMNLIAGTVQLAIIHTFGNLLFKFNVFPEWAKNSTSINPENVTLS